MIAGAEHLGDDVFDNEAVIKFEFIEEDFVVDFGGSEFGLAESVRDEETGVAEVAFELGAVFARGEADGGFGGIETVIYNHGFAEPKEGVFVIAVSGGSGAVGIGELETFVLVL